MKRFARMPLGMVFITQAVDEDDPVLGFTCGWVNALAKRVAKLDVICLRAGKYSVPDSVSIHVIPSGKMQRYFYLRRFLKKAVSEKRIDAIFAHMCPIYAWVASTVVKDRIPIGLWYAHPATSLILKMAVKFSDVIFTSAEGGFPFHSDKVVITGQGIDTAIFASVRNEETKDLIRIISVGRISPIKRYEIPLLAVKMAAEKLAERKISYEIYGPSVTKESKAYSKKLEKIADKYGISGIFALRGAVSYRYIGKVYSHADIVVDMMHGSLDKSALEACACGVPVIAANEHFRSTFGKYADALIPKSPSAEAIAAKIENLAAMSAGERRQIGGYLREEVIKQHSLDSLMKKIVEKFETLPGRQK